MKEKEITLKDRVKGFIVLNFHFMDFTINHLKKEYERGKISESYLKGYVDGVEDFKDMLLKADISILEETLNTMTVKEYTSELCGNTSYISECPSCGEILNSNKRQNYCHNCGQRLEWEQ